MTATHHACFCSPGLCAFIDNRKIGFKMKLRKMDDEKKIELLKKGNKNYEEIYQKTKEKQFKEEKKRRGKNTINGSRQN